MIVDCLCPPLSSFSSSFPFFEEGNTASVVGGGLEKEVFVLLGDRKVRNRKRCRALVEGVSRGGGRDCWVGGSGEEKGGGCKGVFLEVEEGSVSSRGLEMVPFYLGGGKCRAGVIRMKMGFSNIWGGCRIWLTTD